MATSCGSRRRRPCWPSGWAPPTIARCSADDPAATLDRLNAEREPLYQSVATIVIDEQRGTRVLDVAQVAAAVRHRLVDGDRV